MSEPILPEPTRLEEPEAICPWCGEAQSDSWEFIERDGHVEETYCGECEKPISIQIHIWVQYTTSARVEPEKLDAIDTEGGAS